MKNAHTKLAARYLASLGQHLSRRGRADSEPAHRLGRAAVSSGVTILDLARIHENTVIALTERYELSESRNGRLKRAGAFFAQALVPLEADRRAGRESIRHLQQRNDTLRQHTAALARGNRRLSREVARREAGERKFKLSEERYRTLFRESVVMQDKLRQLTRQIISAQEDERKKISHELHDEVVQTLVGINVALSALAARATVSAQGLHRQIARTRRLVENSVNAVHRFARELRPTVLDDLGLIPALHAYSQKLAARHHLRIQMTAFSGVEELSIAKRTVLFRVAQEALTNVARHAHAAHVTLSISERAGAIQLEVADDGKAFDVSRTLLAKNNKRLGLIGMRERIEMIGGTFAIESAPGCGTKVRAEVPSRLETPPL